MGIVHVVDTLRVATPNSILADGVFNDHAIRLANSGHGEGARIGLTSDYSRRGTNAQREELD